MSRTLALSLTALLPACTRHTGEWVADFNSASPLIRRVAAAALVDYRDPMITGALLALDRFNDPDLDAPALLAASQQVNAVQTAEVILRDTPEGLQGRRLAMVLLALPEPANADAIVRLLAVADVPQATELFELLCRHRAAGILPRADADTAALFRWLAEPRSAEPPAAPPRWLDEVRLRDLLATQIVAPASRSALLESLRALRPDLRASWLSRLVLVAVQACHDHRLTEAEALPIATANTGVTVAALSTLLVPDEPLAPAACRALVVCGPAAANAVPKLRELAQHGTEETTRSLAASVADYLSGAR